MNMKIEELSAEIKKDKEIKKAAELQKKREQQKKTQLEPGKLRSATLTTMADEVLSTTFRANSEQRRLKARFWTVYNENPLVDIRDINSTDIVKMTQDHRAANWWGIAGFKNWFLNTMESRERLEYLFDLALDTAEEILLDPSEKAASAKVNMIKIIAELGAKYPKHQEQKFADQQISNMTKEQLDEFLQRQGIEVRKVIEIPKGESSEE